MTKTTKALLAELRDAAKLYDDAGLDGSLGADMCRNAADCITKQAADIERLRDAEVCGRNNGLREAGAAASNILQGYAIEKGNTKTPGGRTANFYRRKVNDAISALEENQ